MHEGDGVNNSQVVLYTGEGVKQNLSTISDEDNMGCRHHHLPKIDVGTNAVEDGPNGVDHLHDNHVVGDEVRVACRSGTLLPPSLVAQMEDDDEEREEEEDVGDGEGGENKITSSGAKAV